MGSRRRELPEGSGSGRMTSTQRHGGRAGGEMIKGVRRERERGLERGVGGARTGEESARTGEESERVKKQRIG